MVDGIPHGEGTLTWVNTNCVYIGEFRNGVYHGEGTFYWNEHGDTLEGTFEYGNPVRGKYTYSNTMSYTGEFNPNWQFHGTGSFDWNTYNADGSVKSWGWLYEGQFKNGSPAGCVGKITFSEARIDPNCEGIHWFEGELDGFPNIKKNQNCKGKIIFSDKSIYEGDLLYDNNGAWHRYGEGVQYFYTSSNYTGASVGGNINDLLYCYKGQFDSLNHMYIYGNGVMYICDTELNPVAYIKGCWDGTTRTASWLPNLGEWSDDMLLPGYEKVEEIEFVHGYYATLKGLVDNHKDVDMSNKTLLVGHSHFTMWYERAAIDLAPEFDAVNFGIGGSNALFWDTNLELLSGLKNDPKHILIHMYDNIAQGDAIENQALIQSVLTKLSAMFPTSQIVCVSGFNTVVYYNTWKQSYIPYTNNTMKAWVESCNLENVSYIDVSGFVFDPDATTGAYYIEGYGYLRTNIWLSDNLHLNVEGHKMFAAAIKAAMNGEQVGGGNGNGSGSEQPTYLFPVLDVADGDYTDLVVDENRKYTGSIVNGVAHGQGTITWLNNGDSLTATWNNGNPVTGTYNYQNGCYYTGTFDENWLFSGEGLFSWPSGWKFEGTFVAGNATYGKTTTTKTIGLIWYEGAMNGLNNIDSNQLGTGHYRYDNTMCYTGQMYAAGALDACVFDGQGRFEWTMYNSDGSVKQWNNQYDGAWVNGSTAGQLGTMTYIIALQGNNAPGLHYFTGIMQDTGLAKVDQVGTGKIVFDDGSYYIGDVYLNPEHVASVTGTGTYYNADGSVKN